MTCTSNLHKKHCDLFGDIDINTDIEVIHNRLCKLVNVRCLGFLDDTLIHDEKKFANGPLWGATSLRPNKLTLCHETICLQLKQIRTGGIL